MIWVAITSGLMRGRSGIAARTKLHSGLCVASSRPGARLPWFEVNTFDKDGRRETRMLRTWQLGSSYPLFRSTQFVRHGASSAFPLSMLDALMFPPILCVVPIGTLIIGYRLVRRRTPARAA